MTKANFPMNSSSCSGLSIYPAFNNTVIAFNNSGVVLKDRSYSDLIDLAIMALESGDKSLLKLFENLPELTELRTMKMREIEKQIFNK
jgi:hypothetical protein